MKFLIDTQLPKILMHRLRDAGHEADHVLDLDLAASPDNDIWHHARQEGYIIITKTRILPSGYWLGGQALP